MSRKVPTARLIRYIECKNQFDEYEKGNCNHRYYKNKKMVRIPDNPDMPDAVFRKLLARLVKVGILTSPIWLPVVYLLTQAGS